MRPLENDLRLGLAALNLPLTDVQVSQLLDYQELIQKWTKVYNLTAVRDPSEMLTHHLLDSLAAIAPLRPLRPSTAVHPSRAALHRPS